MILHRGYQVQPHLPKQINMHLIRLSQAQPHMVRAGSIWKCSQMAKWHQREDKRQERLGSQGDSAASKFRYRLPLCLDAARLCFVYCKSTCAQMCAYTEAHVYVSLDRTLECVLASFTACVCVLDSESVE